MSEQPTPRTDAQVALENPVGIPGNSALISTAFARQLERELAEWKARHWNAHHHSQEFFKDLTAALDQVATLREALGDFIHNVEKQYVTDGARVREDGAYHRLKEAFRSTPETKHPDTERDRATELLKLRRAIKGYQTGMATGLVAISEETYAKLEMDSLKFSMLAEALADTHIGDIDPTQYFANEGNWTEAWRAALDVWSTRNAAP